MAVATSLSRMPNVFKLTSGTRGNNGVLIPLTLLVYDLLNDDDDEIRGLTASVASIIMAASTHRDNVDDLVPLVASKQLLVHLIETCSHDPVLISEAVARLTNSRDQPDARQAFEVASAADTSLFMVEKQNLFIDQQREAGMWADALKRLTRAQRPTTAVRNTLVVWTKIALGLLRERIVSEEDGPLGWASRPDMFIFGMRVWFAVDVVLTWERRYGADNAVVSENMRVLFELVEVMRVQKIHKMWMTTVERMLDNELRERLRVSVASTNVRALQKLLPA